jgi:hypothetical protein
VLKVIALEKVVYEFISSFIIVFAEVGNAAKVKEDSNPPVALIGV